MVESCNKVILIWVQNEYDKNSNLVIINIVWQLQK
jgi:hypothetical protein